MAITEPRDILIQAIFVKWNATAALTTAFPAGIFQEERATSTTANPASGTHFPYAIIPAGGGWTSTRTGQTCASDYWTHPLAFRLYHNDFALCAALVPIVAAVFSSITLSLSLASGSLVKNKEGRIRYVKESDGVCYAEIAYEFETSFPLRA